MITVECPHCQRKINGSDRFAGQYRECPSCGELFVALPIGADDSVDEGEIRLPPAARAPKSPEVMDAQEDVSELSTDSRPGTTEEEVATPATAEIDRADPLPELILPSGDEELEPGSLSTLWRRTLQSRESRSYLISTAVHAIILLILAAWILPAFPETNLPALITFLPETVIDDTVDPIDFSVASQEVDKQPLLEPVAPVSVEAVALNAKSNVFEASRIGDLPTMNSKQGEPDSTKVDTSRRVTNSEPGPEPREATVTQATSVEGATDSIIASIKSKLLERDTAVIWLMDRSVSMQQQRNMLANRLEGYLNHVQETRSDESHSLQHIVVAFGERFERLSVSIEPRKTLMAIRKDYRVDPSGRENVFEAIEWCQDQFVKKNNNSRSMNMMCVVCTDESGDDYLRLERTIQACRKGRLEVSVIGPSAVLGQMQGYHAYTASDNLVYYLPVVRGPDTAFRQRVNLPYWFRDVPGDWDESTRGPWYGGSPNWQGGSNYDAMLSGFGPYALTRLTMATGGDYILYDRPGDGSPFRLDALRPYLPDYREAKIIQADLYDRPLRTAVLQAVEASHQTTLRQPRLDYGAQFGGSYYTPQQFQAGLRNDLFAELQQAQAAINVIDKMISLFENRVVEGLYEQETSPRWKAWYDLTYGRLLAARVRYQMFVETAEKITRTGVKSATNGISIQPVKLAESMLRYTRAADARRILTRCVESNPSTPWFYLARRELGSGFGLAVQEHTVPLVVRRFVGQPFIPKKVSLPRL